MKPILALLLASAGCCAFADAPPLPTPPTRVERPVQSTPFSGPLDPKRFGPRVPFQVDMDALLYSRSITLTIEGKAYVFKGGNFPNTGSTRGVRDATGKWAFIPENDGAIYWRTDAGERVENHLQIVRHLDGSYFGTVWVGARIFQFRGQGKDAVLVETYPRELRDSPPPAASATLPKN